MNAHRGYYSFLLNKYPKEIQLLSERQIDLDITRAFPEDEYFRNPNVIKMLKNILLCYSKRNLTLGYVQGFNFIAGRILKNVQDEEKTFWIFVQVIESILPLDYYIEMAGVMSAVDILVCLFNQMYLTDLMSLLKESIIIYLENILMQWFLSLFSIHFPYESCLAIWDVLFIDNNVVLYKIAIYLIKLIKNDLIKLTDLTDFKNFINHFIETFHDINYIKNILIQKKFDFDQSFINFNYCLLKRKIIETINKNNKKKIERLKEEIQKRNDLCDLHWPFCIYDCESYYRVIDYLVLRQQNPPAFIDNYFDDIKLGEKSALFEAEVDDINFENCLLERKYHCCEGKCKKENPGEFSEENSFISTGTEKSTDKSIEENNYLLRKSLYKSQRTKGRCISSLQFVKEEKIKQSKSKKEDNFQKFLSKNNYKYHQMSVADTHILQSRENFTLKHINYK